MLESGETAQQTATAASAGLVQRIRAIIEEAAQSQVGVFPFEQVSERMKEEVKSCDYVRGHRSYIKLLTYLRRLSTTRTATVNEQELSDLLADLHKGCIDLSAWLHRSVRPTRMIRAAAHIDELMQLPPGRTRELPDGTMSREHPARMPLLVVYEVKHGLHDPGE